MVNSNLEPRAGLPTRRSFLRAAVVTVVGAPIFLEAATSPNTAVASGGRDKLTQDLGGFDLRRFCQEKFGRESRAVLTKPAIGPGVAFDNWACTDGEKRKMINMQRVAKDQYEERPITARPLHPDGANTWHAFTKLDR